MGTEVAPRKDSSILSIPEEKVSPPKKEEERIPDEENPFHV